MTRCEPQLKEPDRKRRAVQRRIVRLQESLLEGVRINRWLEDYAVLFLLQVVYAPAVVIGV